MTPKQTALRNVAFMLATALLAGLAIGSVFTYFTVTQIGIAFCALMFIWALKMLYDMELDKAERLAKLNQSVDK